MLPSHACPLLSLSIQVFSDSLGRCWPCLKSACAPRTLCIRSAPRNDRHRERLSINEDFNCKCVTRIAPDSRKRLRFRCKQSIGILSCNFRITFPSEGIGICDGERRVLFGALRASLHQYLPKILALGFPFERDDLNVPFARNEMKNSEKSSLRRRAGSVDYKRHSLEEISNRTIELLALALYFCDMWRREGDKARYQSRKSGRLR